MGPQRESNHTTASNEYEQAQATRYISEGCVCGVAVQEEGRGVAVQEEVPGLESP